MTTPLRTLIIDDEPIALRKLESYVSKVPFLALAAKCESAFEAMEYMASNPVDLIFTDISMPDLDGLDMVRSMPDAPMVVFTTAHPDYAVESYRVSAVDYLLKPFSMADFQRAATKALRIAESRRPAVREDEAPTSIFVKTDHRLVRVQFSEILYIKGYGEYLQIYLDGESHPLLTLSSFSAILGRLPGEFLQVHRSYIVNMNRVCHIERGRVAVDQETFIPVGDSFKTALNDYISTRSAGIR